MFFVTEDGRKRNFSCQCVCVCLLMGLISRFVMDFIRTQVLCSHLKLEKCFVVYFTEHVSLGNELFNTV